MSDRIVGVFLFVLAVVYGWTAVGYQTMLLGDPLGPSAFPKLLAVLLALASIYLIVRPDKATDWPRGRTLLHLVLTVAVLVAYAFAMEPLGFILATFIALAVLAIQLGTRVVPSLVMGIAASVGLFVVFDLILGLPLPVGHLFGAGA